MQVSKICKYQNFKQKLFSSSKNCYFYNRIKYKRIKKIEILLI
jgi:hypothetical protein